MATEKHIADDRKKVRLIDANELMKFPIRIDHYDKVNGNEHFVLGIESVLEYAEHLPTVDAVEVVHGKWGIYRENEISKTVYCTNCWKEFYIRKKGELQLDMMPYCPNCGAKMDGDGNG